MPRRKTLTPATPDAIRICKAEHPDWKPKQIVEALAESGITTTSQQVSNTLSRMNGHSPNDNSVNDKMKARKKRRRLVNVATNGQHVNGSVEIVDLFQFRDLAERIGRENLNELVQLFA